MRDALAKRPVIDRARGALTDLCSCSADDALEILMDISRHSATQLYDVAEALLTSVQGKPLPTPLQSHLAAAAARMRTRHHGHA
ncbi:ANTAR domain-containing protein [Streptomyces sp. NBC_00414]|uniref:ANTAR domain-containing protein n=1 Tax=Streptomyces sp. NBC_00414 TaxID=2975739 RepID=UPI002E23C58F